MGEQGEVPRRAVLSVMGAGTLAAASAVTVGVVSPDTRAWARPVIAAAVGAPLAAASAPAADYEITAFVSSRLNYKPWTPADGTRPVGFEVYTWTSVISGRFVRDTTDSLRVTPGVAPAGSLQFITAYPDLPLTVIDATTATFTVPTVPEPTFRGNRPIVGTSLDAPQVGGDWTEITEPAPAVFRVTSGRVSRSAGELIVELEITGMDSDHPLVGVEVNYELDRFAAIDVPELVDGLNRFTVEDRYPRQSLETVYFTFDTLEGARKLYIRA